jgi:hypothetical protein
MRYDLSSKRWDSTVTLISSLPPAEEQKFPDYSEAGYYDTSYFWHVMRLAAWQVRKSNRWQIYFSTLNDGSQSWSVPAVLVTDSLDNTAVQIRPFLDTAFIVTWKRANTVMWLMKSMSATTPAETLAVSISDSMEYDISMRGVIWTSDIQGKMTPLFRRIDQYPHVQLSVPETLQVPVPCFAPHLMNSWMPDPTFLFETQKSGKKDVFYFFEYMLPPSFGSLDGDSLSDNRNARSFILPIVTKRAAGPRNSVPSALGLVVFEKNRGADSSLVFVKGFSGDTVRTPGHNRNAIIGSITNSTMGGYQVLVVWESNRTGMGHMYSMAVPIYYASIDDNPRTPAAFELLQNFQNPFNPSTTIRYSLAVGTHVTLTVFNTLGQRVATLVSENQDAGHHDVRFDGSKLSSGVYFYRLQAGDFVESRKMIIVK